MAFNRDEVIISHGKRLAYCDTINGTYVNVFGTIDVSLPERELGAAEITNDDSADFHKDYNPGMYDPGTAPFSYRYTRSQFTALETIYQLATVAATRANATKFWKVTIPDGSTAIFKGFITAHNLPMEGSEDSPVVEGELQVCGKIAWVAAS
jgi:hypothetical protein